MKLNRRQQVFADEYLIDLNATQAAIRAGYSPHTAKDIGAENLAKPHIRAYVDAKMAELSKRTGITQQRVLRELGKIAFYNASDFIDVDTGQLKAGAARDDTAAIAGVRCKSGDDFTEREVKLADKTKALELLMKHLGMLDEKALAVKLMGSVSVQVDYGDEH